MIPYRAGEKVRRGKEKRIPLRNVTNREKETLTKVKKRMWLEENINSQSMVKLPLQSSLSKSSSHRQKAASGTLVLWLLFQRNSGKWHLNKTKSSYVLRVVLTWKSWKVTLDLGSDDTLASLSGNMGSLLISQRTESPNIQQAAPNNSSSTLHLLLPLFPPLRINVPTAVSLVPPAQLKQ